MLAYSNISLTEYLDLAAILRKVAKAGRAIAVETDYRPAVR
jgi:hypothetical protein